METLATIDASERLLIEEETRGLVESLIRRITLIYEEHLTTLHSLPKFKQAIIAYPQEDKNLKAKYEFKLEQLEDLSSSLTALIAEMKYSFGDRIIRIGFEFDGELEFENVLFVPGSMKNQPLSLMMIGGNEYALVAGKSSGATPNRRESEKTSAVIKARTKQAIDDDFKTKPTERQLPAQHDPDTPVPNSSPSMRPISEKPFDSDLYSARDIVEEPFEEKKSLLKAPDELIDLRLLTFDPNSVDGIILAENLKLNGIKTYQDIIKHFRTPMPNSKQVNDAFNRLNNPAAIKAELRLQPEVLKRFLSALILMNYISLQL